MKDLKQLKSDIAKMRAQQKKPPASDKKNEAYGALRLGSDFLAALITGALLGFMMDFWLGTSPWLMIVGLFLGLVAGTLTMLKQAHSKNKT